MTDPGTGDWFGALLAPGADAPGWYGKLLCLGDFAHRRLAATVVVQLDRWLASAMASSRGALGEDWLDAYLATPLWHGVIGEQVLDERTWVALLCPSVDAVGRYFPLVVLAALPAWPLDDAARARLQAWYAACGDAALSTLDGGRTLAQFEAALAAVPSLVMPVASDAAADTSSGAVTAGADACAWQAMTGAALARSLRGRSAWWPASAIDPQPDPVAALPDGADFVAMLRPA